MRLIKPSVGECVDRLTILTLKIRAATKEQRQAEALRAEYAAVQAYLTELVGTAPAGYGNLCTELMEANTSLWELEDKLRVYISKMPTEECVTIHTIADIAISIARKNDLRTDLIGHINRLFNQPQEEKIYVPTIVQGRPGVDIEAPRTGTDS